MAIAFGTKAETLERLAPLLTTARVLPQVRFTVNQWQKEPDRVMSQVDQVGPLRNGVIVRSSAQAEDDAHQSLAGHFTSVLDVRDKRKFKGAVAKVIESYGKSTSGEQLFVQSMLRSVVVSGVAFSIDPSTGSAYVVINYDGESGSTRSVTSGKTNRLKTFYAFKHGPVSTAPEPLDRVLALVDELETIFATDRLDIEFALTADGTLYLLQVRPLPVATDVACDPKQLCDALTHAEQKIRQLSVSHPYLHGSKSAFGVMPDWNPAEMIGVRPRPLTLSLYKELITDSIWAYQRDNYGYRNMRSCPLLVSLGGQPFIDVRVDFNSFIPKDLEQELADKLVNYYIDRLIETPSKHDKVEFEILHTCYTFDLPDRLAELQRHGFSKAECIQLELSLQTLTNRIIHNENGLWRTDAAKIDLLEERQDLILQSELDHVSKIYWLLEDCKRYGTLPFAGLARAGFIAVQVLRSLVGVGILSQEEYDSFMGSLETVSSRMAGDFARLKKSAFLEKYGHLRPGTYDILSPRYDETPDAYFCWDSPSDGHDATHAAAKYSNPMGHRSKQPFRLSIDQLKQTESLLQEHGFEHDALGLFDFIKTAIESREHGKFVFTRSVSAVLTLLEDLGREHNLSRKDVSYLDIHTIYNLYSSGQEAGQTLRSSIENGKRSYRVTKQLVLPPLIDKPEDVWAFHLPPMSPNFITQKSATAHGVSCTDGRDRLHGHILFIPSADPGYDWVFSHGIAGLVTMYGGANSHMAIRAGEIGIPAVIGAGEVLYNQWAAGELINIDCMNRQVKVLR